MVMCATMAQFLLVLVPLILLSADALSASKQSPPQSRSLLSKENHPQANEHEPRRRQVLQSLSFLSLVPANPTEAEADAIKDSIVSPKETLNRLRRVPTFCIVDGIGVPFMTYNSESAAANGYFFLNYENAESVLEDARKAYKEAEGTEGVSDSWGESRIVSLPLDYAMRLTVKQNKNIAQNGLEFRTIIQVLPSATDLDSALIIENSVRFKQRGRVPLFYEDELKLTSNDGSVVSPVFFTTRDLKAAWKRQNPSSSTPPKIKVRELSETFRAMIKPGGNDESVKDIVFIPNGEAVNKSLEVRKQQGDGQVYKTGEIILTK